MSNELLQPKTLNFRLQEIDFLRGLAIIIVLFRHHWLTNFTFNAGWIGVDLFFVLSGFLVSGLLFSEYKRFGDIKPFHFLVRRGFKIYPMFYFSIFLTLIIILLFANTSVYVWNVAGLNYKGILIEFLVEICFLQNYFFYSTFWGHHWSLAVEEHFYFLLVILLFFLVKIKKLEKQKVFLFVGLFIFIGCLILRIISNVYMPDRVNFYDTHLRIDSLFAGVFISYFYNFNPKIISDIYRKLRYLIWAAIIPLISFTLFIDPIRILTFVDPDEFWMVFFVKTVGFTLVYISFSFLLIVFIEEKNINLILTKVLGKTIFGLICKVGFYSYGIYLFHEYVAVYGVGHNYLAEMEKAQVTTLSVFFSFLIYFFISILLGIIIARVIEIPFIKLREIYIPKRKIENSNNGLR